MRTRRSRSTQRSPLGWAPLSARENRRRNGRKGATCCARAMLLSGAQGALSALQKQVKNIQLRLELLSPFRVSLGLPLYRLGGRRPAPAGMLMNQDRRLTPDFKDEAAET